jgi:hypothetical protein
LRGTGAKEFLGKFFLCVDYNIKESYLYKNLKLMKMQFFNWFPPDFSCMAIRPAGKSGRGGAGKMCPLAK